MDDLARQLDHLVIGAPDLEAACDSIAARTGVRPPLGGRHTSGGTWNALAALGHRCYLEIIAPDPAAPREARGWYPALAALGAPRPFAFACVAPGGIDALAARANAAGIAGSVEEGGRVTATGTRLRWRLFEPETPFGDLFPFFIDWGDSPHPCGDAPPGLTLAGLSLCHPDPAALSAALAALGLSATIDKGLPAIRALLDTPHGRIEPV